jgi:hypothetical protein
VRQKAKGRRVGYTTGDIKQDLTAGQLAGIGAVSMAWNSVESFVDELLLAALGLQARIALEIIVRMSAFDAKVALVKSAANARLGISPAHSEDLWSALDGALGYARDLKNHRDKVIHAQLIDAGEAIGRVTRRDREHDVLMSQEALDALYERLISVRNELRAICLIFLILSEAVKNNAQADLKTLLHGSAIQGHVSQAQDHRKARLSLPPLPKLPQ